MKYQLQEKMGPEKAINIELMVYKMNGAATVKTLQSCSAADIKGGGVNGGKRSRSETKYR